MKKRIVKLIALSLSVVGLYSLKLNIKSEEKETFTITKQWLGDKESDRPENIKVYLQKEKQEYYSAGNVSFRLSDPFTGGSYTYGGVGDISKATLDSIKTEYINNHMGETVWGEYYDYWYPDRIDEWTQIKLYDMDNKFVNNNNIPVYISSSSRYEAHYDTITLYFYVPAYYYNDEPITYLEKPMVSEGTGWSNLGDNKYKYDFVLDKDEHVFNYYTWEDVPEGYYCENDIENKLTVVNNNATITNVKLIDINVKKKWEDSAEHTGDEIKDIFKLYRESTLGKEEVNNDPVYGKTIYRATITGSDGSVYSYESEEPVTIKERYISKDYTARFYDFILYPPHEPTEEFEWSYYTEGNLDPNEEYTKTLVVDKEFDGLNCFWGYSGTGEDDESMILPHAVPPAQYDLNDHRNPKNYITYTYEMSQEDPLLYNPLTITKIDNNNWEYKATHLHSYLKDSSGNYVPASYYVQETPVDGYNTTYSGDDNTKAYHNETITNSIKSSTDKPDVKPNPSAKPVVKPISTAKQTVQHIVVPNTSDK